ncbi:MAG: AAA family ATPase [Bacteroidia bacterium]|nr:AAA family ATPase [Bacteroidia bacterium]
MKDRLVIKNFGPIRDLDIELKDVMIFIGPQGSGKSTIAKVISLIRDKTLSVGLLEELKNFQLEIDLFKGAEIQYSYKGRVLEFRASPLNHLDGNHGDSKTFQTQYIPAERGFLPHLVETSLAFQDEGVPLPKTLLRFGSLFQKARFYISEIHINGTGLTYKFKNGQDRVFHNETESISLVNSASGIQALLPMVLVIEYLVTKNGKEGNTFVIEEPELNLYPTTQKALTENLVEKCTHGHNKLILTTHSPYILTSLDNLILAHNIVREKPELREEVAKIVPEEQWLDFDRVGVWYVDKGTATSILDKDFRSIGANKIDDVSEEIGTVFDQLTALRYQEERA